MRNITENITAAFIAGAKRSDGNTHTDGKTLWLHGNAIARRATLSTAKLEVSFAGWPTSTTKERINGVMAAAGSVFRFSFVKRVPHIFNTQTGADCGAVSPDSWLAVSDAKGVAS